MLTKSESMVPTSPIHPGKARENAVDLPLWISDMF